MSAENQKARKQRGRTDRSAGFPIAPTHKGLPDDYGKLLEEIKTSIQRERVKVVLAGNLAMLAIYWDIGHRILERQSQEGWGAKVIDRLSEDLRQAFPDMNGFSPRNIKYMRAFAKTWPRAQIVQEPLAQLTWYHHLALMEKLEAHEERLWYAKQTLQHGWSRNILAIQIENQLHKRQGKARSFEPGGSTHPIGVAEWQTQLTRTLPEDLKPSLPSIEELEAEFSTDWEGK